MKRSLFSGCGIALITPFKNGSVDFEAFDRILDKLINAKVDALVPCGTTGEPAVLTDEEWKSVISFTVKKVAGRIPVIAGTGSNNTAHVIERAHIAKELGADAQLVVTPYYNKTTQAGIIAHFTAIADDGSLPVIVYNVPSRTGLDIAPDTYRVLADHPNIIGIKDACGDVTKALALVNAVQGKVAVYSGDDQLVAPLRTIGYDGVISVTANVIPKTFVTLCHTDIVSAGRLQAQLYVINKLMFCETSPIPVKYALSRMGLCENELRLPLVPMSEANAALMARELERLEVL